MKTTRRQKLCPNCQVQIGYVLDIFCNKKVIFDEDQVCLTPTSVRKIPCLYRFMKLASEEFPWEEPERTEEKKRDKKKFTFDFWS